MKTIGIVLVALMVLGTVFCAGCIQGDTGAQGAQGIQGVQGETGEKGDMPAHQWNGTQVRFQNPDGTWGDYVDLEGPQGTQGTSGMNWGTPVAYGPTVLDIGTSSGRLTIPSLDAGDRVTFTFSVSGSSVYYKVLDPFDNIILTGDLGNAVMSGEGAFIAATSGDFVFRYESTGIVTPSVITTNCSVYPVS